MMGLGRCEKVEIEIRRSRCAVWKKSKLFWEEKKLLPDGMEIVCEMIIENKAEFQESLITKQRNLDTVQ